MQEALHALAFSLFGSSSDSVQRSEWQCPVSCFAALFHLRRDGVFKEAGQVSSNMAALKYAVRVVMGVEIANAEPDTCFK